MRFGNMSPWGDSQILHIFPRRGIPCSACESWGTRYRKKRLNCWHFANENLVPAPGVVWGNRAGSLLWFSKQTKSCIFLLKYVPRRIANTVSKPAIKAALFLSLKVHTYMYLVRLLSGAENSTVSRQWFCSPDADSKRAPVLRMLVPCTLNIDGLFSAQGRFLPPKIKVWKYLCCLWMSHFVFCQFVHSQTETVNSFCLLSLWSVCKHRHTYWAQLTVRAPFLSSCPSWGLIPGADPGSVFHLEVEVWDRVLGVGAKPQIPPCFLFLSPLILLGTRFLVSGTGNLSHSLSVFCLSVSVCHSLTHSLTLSLSPLFVCLSVCHSLTHSLTFSLSRSLSGSTTDTLESHLSPS